MTPTEEAYISLHADHENISGIPGAPESGKLSNKLSSVLLMFT